NISSGNPVFTASPTSFTLNPGASQQVTMTFTPTAAGAVTGNATITHNAANGSSTVSLSGTGDTHSTGLSTSTGRFSVGVPASAWVLMSVPYTLDNTAASALSSQLTGEDAWKMFVFSGGAYQDISTSSSAFQLARGFWFKTAARTSAFHLNFGGGSVVTSSTQQITVPTGWSIIGTPFYNNEATWSPVNTTAGSSGIRVWKYAHESNSWVGPLNPSTERMKPFEGYAVYNQTGAAAAFTFTRGPVTSGSVREWQEGDGWYLTLNVGDASLRIGEHRSAAEGLDLYDYPMPPSVPDATTERASLAGKLWSDIRPVENDAVTRWKVTIVPSGSPSIEIEEAFGIPPGWRVLAEGIPGIGSLALEQGKRYTLPDVAVPYTLVLVAGPQRTAEQEAVPASFSLSQNYPNPFNPSTTVTYQLASEGEVSLKVFNMLGEEVATLVGGYQKPGTYEVQWNGKNNDGAVVPSGIYFYSLRSGAFIDSKRMLLLK
ncbi:MAG TPA: FlgD immunoglobulin-like domain containing protein, partial [Bacteroidota bacterium]